MTQFARDETTPEMIGVALFGAGRIGRLHARNIAALDGVRLRVVVDPNRENATEIASRSGARVTLDARERRDRTGRRRHRVPTDTHVELIRLAAAARKAVFCEKPIDIDRHRVDAVAVEVARAGIPFAVGFNRRCDPNFRALKRAVDEGAIGRVETLSIVSRDPAQPPIEYARSSGGLFRDMTIHDSDIVRWLLGSEPVRVNTMAAALVDPSLAELGDVDTAMVTLDRRCALPYREQSSRCTDTISIEVSASAACCAPRTQKRRCR